jgi:nucleotide-binding universal stress UspA family protein
MSDSAAALTGGRPRIVVGVDGSGASNDALKWAADYAALVGGELLALSVWQWPVSLGMALALPEGYSPRADANSVLADAIKATLGASPAVPVVSEVVEGSAAAALVEASGKAALLVVGSRGHGGFVGLMLGSTSEHCARHAVCPVVVVRHQSTEGLA